MSSSRMILDMYVDCRRLSTRRKEWGETRDAAAAASDDDEKQYFIAFYINFFLSYTDSSEYSFYIHFYLMSLERA